MRAAMSATDLLLWTLFLSVFTTTRCSPDNTSLKFDFTHLDGTNIGNVDKYCKTSVCLVKCCPQKQIMLSESETQHNCVSSSELIKKYGVKNPDSYTDIAVFNKDIEHKQKRTSKSVNDFKLIYSKNFTSSTTYLPSFDEILIRTYLLEDGKWVFRRVNYWHQWYYFEPRRFCIEHEVYLEESGNIMDTTPSVVVWVISSSDPPTNRRAILSACAMVVSCFFLLLVLAVHAALPRLRNLAGLNAMACMATYFTFFLIRIIHVFSNESQVLTLKGSITLTILFYYFMLATFFWINVMSFDIWTLLRGIKTRTSSQRPRRRVLMNKFCWYCAYAWGLPILPTLFVVIVDQLDLTDMPNFVKPHIFDNTGSIESDVHFMYVGMPILIVNVVNVSLFLMTAYNIWQNERNMSRHNSKDSTNNKRDKKNFHFYLKLSSIMGVSWVLEVVGNIVNPESWLWIISDLYNALVGLLIFIFFVCKKKIFLQLCSRFDIDNEFVRSLRNSGDSRARETCTKSSSHHTETSDVEGNCIVSYKNVKN